MAFRPPGNVVRLRVSKFRQFDGIGGPRYQILSRKNDRGWDISNSIVNELYDLNCGQPGTMRLRDGCRKIDYAGKGSTFDGVFAIGVGRRKRYGIKYGEVVDIVDIPEWFDQPQIPFTFAPVGTPVAASNVYPASDPGMPL